MEVKLMPRRKRSLLVFIVLALFMTPLASAGSVLYASWDSPSDPALYIVSPTTAAATLVGPFGIPTNDLITALAYDSSNGSLYAAQALTHTLVTVNTTTGLASPVGGFGENITSMAFDDSSGTMYGADGSNLYSISLMTGLATLITPISGAGSSGVVGLAIDPTTHVLYGGDGTVERVFTEGRLLTLNKTTGVATVVGGTGAPPFCSPAGVPLLNSLAFDSSGQLFASSSPCGGGVLSTLWTVDKSTGSLTTVGIINFGTHVEAIEFVETSVPEPPSLIPVALLLMVLARIKPLREISNFLLVSTCELNESLPQRSTNS
jgi:hypothetical protein